MNKDVKVESHPSYGQAVFHRVTGSIGKLYGSPLTDHHSVIRLTISRSEMHHEHGRNWRFGRDQLIEVTFSAAQFAELLTNMNVSEGAPCTIDFIRGEGSIESPPEEQEVEHEKVVKGFEGKIAGTVKKLRENLIKLGELLEKKSPNKEDRQKIYSMVEGALQEVEANSPFVLEQFGEATEKMVSAAKAEMAATTIAIVQKLGFEKLEDLRQVTAAPERRSHFEYLDAPKKDAG